MKAEQCCNTSLPPNEIQLKQPKQIGIKGNLVPQWNEGRKPLDVTQLEVSLLNRPPVTGHLEKEYELSITVNSL